jgi:hypothetical protein
MSLRSGILILGLAFLAAIVVIIDQVGCHEAEAAWELPALTALSFGGYAFGAVGLYLHIPSDVFARPLIPLVVMLFALMLTWFLAIGLAPECVGPGLD